MKKIYIPSNLDLPALLDQEYRNEKDIDRLHYIVNLIYEQRVLYKNPAEFVPLKAIYMRNIIGRQAGRQQQKGGWSASIYKQILIDKGVLECDGYYIKDEKSYGYKLCEPYSTVRHKQISISCPILQSNIEKWQMKRLPKTEVHNHLYKFLSQITINYEAAAQYIDSMSVQEYNSLKIAIDKFKNKDFFIYCDDFGERVHTNVTNLKSTLRKYLSYDNQRLVNIDVANSQPLLLLVSIPSLSNTIRCTGDIYFEDVPSDVLCYKRLVEQGKLYEFLMDKAGETDRSSFKENFFRETFFGKRTSNLFCRLFPTIGEEIKKVKKRNHKRLARLMQRRESKLIITAICGRIMKEHPDLFIATIHDSILTTPGNVPTIKRIMSEEFEKIGIRPKIREE